MKKEAPDWMHWVTFVLLMIDSALALWKLTA